MVLFSTNNSWDAPLSWQKLGPDSEILHRNSVNTTQRSSVPVAATKVLSSSFVVEDVESMASYRLLQFPHLLRAASKICMQDSEGCMLYDRFTQILSQHATFTMNAARLHVVQVDPIVWLRNVDESLYRHLAQDLVREIRGSPEHIRFKGSDFVLICLTHYCQRFAEELAPILSDDMGNRVIFAGVDIDVRRLKWPCPLRLINIEAGQLENLQQLSEELIYLATVMIHTSNRWLCYDKERPANYFGEHTTDEPSGGMWVKEHGLLMCYIPKCGSTMTTMLVRRLMHKENWNSTANGLPHDPSVNGVFYMGNGVDFDEMKRIYEDPHIIKAVIARHPISRLLSGYLDKIITRREYYRVKDLPDFVKQHGVPNFSQFVDYLIKTYPDPYKIDDVHFIIQSHHCGLRNHTNDFVGYLNDLGADFEEFAKSIGIWEDYVSTGWGKDQSQAFGVKSYEDVQHHSANHLWEHYTAELMHKVYDYYRDDFVRFGFSIEEMLETE